jgi:dTDP-glucose pyrophosphorylase
MKKNNIFQIIIPMSGFGERFRRAGYKVPKPLIKVEEKPIIAHVIDMFPGESDFIFICNQDHLDNPEYHMKDILDQYCPTGKIIGIKPHKLGPIYAVQQVENLIDTNRPVVVNYCDFACYWSWIHFKNFVIQTKCIGAIPAYKGFHPHSLGSTNYAYMRETNGWVDDIQEKQPYTNNRMEEFASSGTYYFSSGKVMSESFKATVDNDLNLSGEFYVSLAYKHLLKQGSPVAVYPLQHFMQWGTPQDVAEYNMWSKIFRRLLEQEAYKDEVYGSLIIPMAGLGQRFVDEGYQTTKPLIPVSEKPMVIQATNDFPNASNYVFVLRNDMPGYQEISLKLSQTYPNAVIKTIDRVTEGQACTALIGLEALEEENDTAGEWVTFGACDNGMLYNKSTFKKIINDTNVDIIVWAVRGHANAIRHPQMFGWIESNESGKISNISVKEPLESPETDPIVIGAFTFRHAKDYHNVINHLIERGGRVNGEFYIDTCINDAIDMGLSCQLFEVDSFISWGTPNDLKTFEYWQSCFHKWNSHPYRLELDKRVNQDALMELEKKYTASIPEYI